MKPAIFALMALWLAACGQQPPPAAYPPHYELNFMQACQAREAAALCRCVWDRIAAEVPRADFDALERAPLAERETSPLTRQIEGYAVACNTAPAGTP